MRCWTYLSVSVVVAAANQYLILYLVANIISRNLIISFYLQMFSNENTLISLMILLLLNCKLLNNKHFGRYLLSFTNKNSKLLLGFSYLLCLRLLAVSGSLPKSIGLSVLFCNLMLKYLFIYIFLYTYIILFYLYNTLCQ